MKKLILIPKGKKDTDILEEDIDMDFFDCINAERFMKAANDKMAIRRYEEFEKKAIRLDSAFDYIVGLDSAGERILVPLKKK